MVTVQIDFLRLDFSRLGLRTLTLDYLVETLSVETREFKIANVRTFEKTKRPPVVRDCARHITSRTAPVVVTSKKVQCEEVMGTTFTQTETHYRAKIRGQDQSSLLLGPLCIVYRSPWRPSMSSSTCPLK
jgi:hypothetical protein